MNPHEERSYPESLWWASVDVYVQHTESFQLLIELHRKSGTGSVYVCVWLRLVSALNLQESHDGWSGVRNNSCQSCVCVCVYLIESVKHGSFLQEIRNVFLPVELVWFGHDCSQTWNTHMMEITHINIQKTQPHPRLYRHSDFWEKINELIL